MSPYLRLVCYGLRGRRERGGGGGGRPTREVGHVVAIKTVIVGAQPEGKQLLS